jgi:hypothetical protein
MNVKLISMLLASALVSAGSFGFKKSEECVSSDGSSILFQNKPSTVPVRMYITHQCFYGKPNEHHLTLGMELKNPNNEDVLFDGYAVFSYYFDSLNDITYNVNQILKYGILEGRVGRFSKYKIVDQEYPNVGYISEYKKYDSVFDCIDNFCNFRSFVDEISILYTFRGRFPEGFDPAVAEDVIRGFVGQVFNM